jgi:hypothetical protein
LLRASSRIRAITAWTLVARSEDEQLIENRLGVLNASADHLPTPASERLQKK